MTTYNLEVQVIAITGTYGDGDDIPAGTSYEMATLTLTEDPGDDDDLRAHHPGEAGLTWALDGVDLGAFPGDLFYTVQSIGGVDQSLRGFSFAGVTYFHKMYDSMETGVDLHAHTTLDGGTTLNSIFVIHAYEQFISPEDALRFTGQAWYEELSSTGVLTEEGLRDVLVYDPDGKTSFVNSTYEQQIRSPEYIRNIVDVWGTLTVSHAGGVITDVAVMRSVEVAAVDEKYHYFFDTADLAAGGITVADVIGIANFVVGADDVAKWTDLGLIQTARNFQGTNRTDDIVATALDDTFFGNDGDDTLFGGKGADIAYGGKDADVLHGEGGTDLLYGDGAADDIYGGGGADTIRGGAGNDTLTGGNGEDFIKGQFGDDVVFGGDDADRIVGGDGNDDLYGGGGSDVLLGDVGDDTLSGGGAADVLTGDAGADTFYGGSGDDSLYGGDQDDYIDAGAGADLMYGGTGNDDIIGGTEGDTLYGSDGNDILKGGRGSDTLYGGDQQDDLKGQKGADILYGGSDVDTLEGAEGDDILGGGTGADIFVFADATNLGDDTLTDWQDGADILQIAGAVFADLTITYTTDTLIAWNGNTLTLTGITTGIDASDFDFV